MHTSVLIYDIVAARVGFGPLQCGSPCTHGRSFQAGWTKLLRRCGVCGCLMLEIARRSGGVRFLLWSLYLGPLPTWSQLFPGAPMGIPYKFERMIEAHVFFRTEGLMGITTRSWPEDRAWAFLVFAGVLMRRQGAVL